MYFDGEWLQGTKGVNPEGAVEVKVETVDHRSPPGNDQTPKGEKVQVIHEYQEDGGAGGSVLASASAALARTLHSAKDAISGNKPAK